jgi:hypothetical protein
MNASPAAPLATSVAVVKPDESSDVSMCRRISFLLPKDFPELQAVRPDFFQASLLVQEFSCGAVAADSPRKNL